MDEEEQTLADAIQSIKSELGKDLLILGHHYQRDQIVMHARFAWRFIPPFQVSLRIRC